MSDLLLTNILATRNRVEQLERQEVPGAVLTLTRSATLAITTGGTIIPWQVETRNQGFTWSGTTITIPANGFYNFFFFGQVAANQINFFTIISSSNLLTFGTVRAPSTTAGAMYYFNAGDTFTIQVIASANATMNANVRMDIVQLTSTISS